MIFVYKHDHKLLILIKEKFFWINLLICLIIIILTFKNNNTSIAFLKFKNVVKKSLFGLIIAFFCYVDMIFAPFWFILLFGNLLEGFV